MDIVTLDELMGGHRTDGDEPDPTEAMTDAERLAALADLSDLSHLLQQLDIPQYHAARAAALVVWKLRPTLTRLAGQLRETAQASHVYAPDHWPSCPGCAINRILADLGWND